MAFRFLIFLLATCIPFASAIRLFESNSLVSCMENSKFSASYFHVVFTPDNATVFVDINADSGISGFVNLEFQVSGYGYPILQKVINPCQTTELKGLCPMSAAPITLAFNTPLPKDQIAKAPGVIYYVPDIDAKVRVLVNSIDGTPLACVEAHLTNGQTVYQAGVAWTVALVAILGFIVSAIMAGFGHSNTATHVASNSMSLFAYFQALAFIGMTANPLPPVVRGWTQNFQWSMGIIELDFLQTMATWYQRATGGTPSSLISRLSMDSVIVQKRALGVINRAIDKRADITGGSTSFKMATVSGIERVGFVAGIERSNIFFTSYTFLLIFILFALIGVVLFRYIIEALIRSGKMRPDRFTEFRSGWKVVLKGVLYRIALIAFPQVVVVCLWELTQRDSAGEVILAITTFLTVTCLVAWGAWKVWTIGRRSLKAYHNPAYVLYSDSKVLNKWGFLYDQFTAPLYFFILPLLLLVFIKGCFVAFAQESGLAQAIGLLVTEAALLITLSVVKPFLDKRTNGWNIAIAAVGFFNVFLLLFFTGAINVPPLVIGIMSLLFFIVNVIFALVILIKTLSTLVRAISSKDPESRYQPMRDDRASFIKSPSDVGTTELDALGVAARGDPLRKTPLVKRMELDDESEDERERRVFGIAPMKQPYSTAYARDNSASPTARTPLFASSSPIMRGSPSGFAQRPHGFSPSASPFVSTQQLYQPANPLRPGHGVQRSASPWQRGVGY